MKNFENAASAQEVAQIAKNAHGKYAESAAYKLAFADESFLTDPETRAVRLQLEIMKPDMVFRREGIKHTLTVFGSARFKDTKTAQELLASAKTPEEIQAARLAVKNAVHYEKAYRFSQLVAQRNLSLEDESERIHVLTGGGPGIMEAANRGAFELGDKTIGMNIALPFEQEPNPYITPSLCFDFHYFASRKFSFLSAGSSTYGPTLVRGQGMSKEKQVGGGGSIGMVCFAGGFGTLDEAFECLTLVQTKKVKDRPIIFVGKEYWTNFINIPFLAEEGVISKEDVALFNIVDTPEEAWKVILDFYKLA